MELVTPSTIENNQTMRLHLPLGILAAVMATVGDSYAVEVEIADVTNTVYWNGGGNARGKATVVTPEYVGSNVDEFKAALTDAAILESKKYKRPVVFDASGNETKTATIENWGTSDSAVTITSGLFVRDGAVTIKDSNIVTNLGEYQSSGSVSGNNATLILDGTKMSSASKSTDIYYVGGQSGAGKLVLKGQSQMTVDTWMLVGISKYVAPQGNSGYNTRVSADSKSSAYTGGVYSDPKCPYTGDSSDPKKGAYNDFNTGHEHGDGTIEVLEGSTLTLGGSIGTRESNITVSGQGSLIETGTKYQSAPSGNNEEKSDLIARGSGSVSRVNILNGGKWHTHSWFTTASLTSFETKAYITVDGAGSVLQADMGLGLGYGVGNEKYDTPNIGSTVMLVTNGGKVVAGDIYVGLGEKNLGGAAYNRRGANPVFLYVDKDSSMETTGKFRVNDAVYGLGTVKVDTEGFDVKVVMEGTVNAKLVELDGGTFSLEKNGVINAENMVVEAGGEFTLVDAIAAANVNADLILQEDSQLTLEGNSVLDLNNHALTIEDGAVINFLNSELTIGQEITLFANIAGYMKDGALVAYEDGAEFRFLLNGYETVAEYRSNENGVGGSVVYTIPEPTTATLSLLALAGLAMRRRRK